MGEPEGEWSASRWSRPCPPNAWPEGAVAAALLLFSQGLSSGARRPVQAEQGWPGHCSASVTLAPLAPSGRAHISGNSFCKGEWWGHFLGSPLHVGPTWSGFRRFIMPELVKVAEEGPGWEPEISGRENQGVWVGAGAPLAI